MTTASIREQPLVSIVMPTYNRLQFLPATVQSIFSQTFRDWELIVADDGSDEQTQAYLHALGSAKVRVLRLAHCGNPSRVRNAALWAASGRYVAFLDSDDVWSPRKLEMQLAAFDASSHCRWSYTACNRIDSDGRPLSPTLQPTTPVRSGWIFEPLLSLEAAVAMPTLVAERSLLEEVGGFDDDQLYGEFHDLCLRLALRSEVIGLADALCSVRAHNEHYSANRMAAYLSWMRLYEKYCQLAPTARTRARSARMRALAALSLATLQGADRDSRSVWRTLRAGKVLSWRYPRLWHRWALALLRPFVPWRLRTRSRLQERVVA